MIKDVERIQAARRIKVQAEINIEFLKDRIEKQKEPGFNRFSADGASGRTYSQLDVDREQAKLERAQEIINSYKN